MSYIPKRVPKPAAEEMPPKKAGKTWFAKVNAWLHLWPSIVSGLVVVFVCLTGTLIVYCDEILEWSAGDARYVEVQNQQSTSDQLIQAIHDFDPELELSELVYFNDPYRSIRVRAFHKQTHKLTFLYVDPYSAKVLKADTLAHFFYITAHLHSALLAGPVGSWIVLIATVIFFISCVTGLVLWWPKRWTKKTVQDSFTIKWKARFKRFNYDLHNVYGFYSLLLCFVLSLTGIIIFFHSLGDLITSAFGGVDEHIEEVLGEYQPDRPSHDINALAYHALADHPKEKNAAIWVYALDEAGVYVFRLGVTGLKSTEGQKLSVYDRYTGLSLAVPAPQRIHEEVENVIWQLHMGQWWGQFGKLSTFLAGIVATSLPITGFLIWWGRRKKKIKKKTVKTTLS
ncbi:MULTISPECIES: PepSY-associated TM helix domain-containing protein [Sphingobacterium]|uniref:PepSY-associated TM helix domain-containing protein n=1 Tax=Sphingobacterium TaxID=28453 RepID=UPI0013DB43C7|nr:MULTISPECIES: PepSY-associated TM helix domain-containing protein [unclassified Sphingobacterium]